MEEQKNFVVQKHQKESELTHWDLMLESVNCLETYRIAAPPEDWAKGAVEAVKIFDHPLKFLVYEGPVNQGKGLVKIADMGKYHFLTRTDSQQQICFSGNIIHGKFQLRLIESNKWELKSI